MKKFWSALFYDAAVVLTRLLVYWPTGGIRGYGRKNVPRRGPVIIAPNHVSHLDPPAVALTCPRRLRFMAKEELFRNPLFGALLRACRAFPVRRGTGDTEAIRWTLASLERGEAVLMFPEGTRGDARQLGFVNRGVVMIAKRSGAKIVPVAVVGTHKKMPRGGRLKWGFVRVAFGEPFTYEDVVAKAGSEKEAREAFIAEWERQIIAMAGRFGLELRSAPKTPPTTSPSCPGTASESTSPSTA